MWIHHIQRQRDAGVLTLPSVQIAVIGGYQEVLRFLERSKALVPSMTRRMAALDADAEPMCIPPAPSASCPVPKLTIPQELYHAQKGDVIFLPWTPEVGLSELIRLDFKKHAQGIKDHTGITNLVVSNASFNSHVGKTGKDQRDSCKIAIEALASTIAQKKNWSTDRARESLFAYLVQATANDNVAVMRQLSGKLFS